MKLEFRGEISITVFSTKVEFEVPFNVECKQDERLGVKQIKANFTPDLLKGMNHFESGLY